MIITRTPLRISFFGGGTDYPAWYSQNRGAVLSTAVNKYLHISCRFLPPFFKYTHRIVYAKTEHVSDVVSIDHPSVRETMRFLNFHNEPGGLEIHYSGDLPAMSGMGSSASFTVGLLNSLSAFRGEIKSKHQLAMEAIHIDQNMVKENVGSQDHVAAAFGGFNRIEFGGPGHISVNPVILPENKLNRFQDHLLLFFTDFSRKASKIAKGWIRNTPKNEAELREMLAMVDEGHRILIDKNSDLKEFGKLLDRGWKIKRTLAPQITNPKIDAIYEAGRKAGALGGKLLGAGNGGFMLFFADPGTHKKIKDKLGKLLCVPIGFDFMGSQIIYYSKPTKYQ